MKLYLKLVSKCTECPNVSYIHFDGEGECCPYQYNWPVCTAVLEKGEHKDVSVEGKKGIPDWCPLEEGEKMEKLQKMLIEKIYKQLETKKMDVQTLDVLNRLLATVNHYLITKQ